MSHFLLSHRLMPVITPYAVDSTVELINCLVKSGISAVEITLRTSCSMDALKAVIGEFSDSDLTIGVGTINRVSDFESVAALGVDFAISPGINRSLLDCAKDSSVPLLPGIATPSDILLGLEYDYQYFKLFPAEASGGIPMLRALSGPFPQLKFCPTGGININNATDYLALENVICIGGSWMLPKQAILEGDWVQIEKLTRRALQL